ncbi:DUF2778 domain-containing protein [Burkholderia sp. AW33-5]|uniref:DUF2778 domain-containing protein n=1 Tax=Burkholderia sp. RF4-BP95 TaxID=1637845 RepID=UPI0027BADA11|nr:DUF2778 domain-containing protein [Burkholderia sp. RF4-BP95]
MHVWVESRISAFTARISDRSNVRAAFNSLKYRIATRIENEMIPCSFELNDQPISHFQIRGLELPAFSGLPPYVNARTAACVAERGPIPPGEYYVVDRRSGGRLGWLHDRVGGKSEWFALYAADGSIDDATLCDDVQRGQFRLHPRGLRGISRGCIVIDSQSDFRRLRELLVNNGLHPIPGSMLRAYGMVAVW